MVERAYTPNLLSTTSMQPTTSFQEPITGHTVIAGNHTSGSGTTNYNFACQSIHDRPTRPREPFSTVPFAPDPDFVDRPKILAWVHNKCGRQGARAALVGLGGVGKSQLAIQYAHSICDANLQRFVFWVHASTQTRFEEAYRGIADRLKLPGRLEPKADVLRLVSNWLSDETNGQWTMVLDNVDDVETFFPLQQPGQEKPPASLADYLPQSRNGTILITSRSKDAAARLAGGHNNIWDVLAMKESQGLQLLRNKLQDQSSGEAASIDLVRALDCMPLAITQASAYINRGARMSIASYLSEFHASEKKRESLLNWDAGDLRRDKTAANSVVTTWQMSFERIRQERPSAADLLSLMSYFNPQGIPEEILQRYSNTAARARAFDNKDEADRSFEEDLNTLHVYSLVTITMDNETCGMHALVQFCTRVWLSASRTSQQWEQEFVVLMAREFPRVDFKNWKTCQQLIPHIYSLYERKPSNYDLLGSWAWVLLNAARYVQTAQGKYEEAEKLIRRALEGMEKELGVHHPSTLTSVSDLALVLGNQGKYEEAEKLNRRALEGYEKELGVHHLDTLMSINNLALVLQDQGKYEEAEKLNWRALEGCKKELGVHHPDTLTSVGNLAGVLQDQGKYEEAEKLNRRALEGREKELGVHHPSTLTSVSNLALVLQCQGKYNEAEKLNRRALEGREKELGVHHPDTLTSVSNLALVLQDQGKYEEAEKLNWRALEGREKELGVHHPDTLRSVSNLAYLLRTIGRYAEAVQLYQRAYNGYVQVLGSQHPRTIACGNHFLALQQEAQQTALADNQDSDQQGKKAIVNPTSIESTFARASSRPKDKEDSILARIKQRMRRIDR